MTENRRKVRVLCFKEVYLDECSIGNIIEPLTSLNESSTTIDPTRLHSIATDIQALKKKDKLDSIELVRTSFCTIDAKCVKIEESSR